ncbi:hypothetical protein EX30DRAFT_341400 [Ascodesmis nigricans]|uniref:Transmembrane protein n=1 Tax=Ascodesmis nigricans TaxID=341454 RepID=A0A4S2MVC3_9PEZI|nr:hypothetical protein EX30DRAFT_341400 [Ascodesmis nigricans]
MDNSYSVSHRTTSECTINCRDPVGPDDTRTCETVKERLHESGKFNSLSRLFEDLRNVKPCEFVEPVKIVESCETIEVVQFQPCEFAEFIEYTQVPSISPAATAATVESLFTVEHPAQVVKRDEKGNAKAKALPPAIFILVLIVLLFIGCIYRGRRKDIRARMFPRNNDNTGGTENRGRGRARVNPASTPREEEEENEEAEAEQEERIPWGQPGNQLRVGHRARVRMPIGPERVRVRRPRAGNIVGEQAKPEEDDWELPGYEEAIGMQPPVYRR